MNILLSKRGPFLLNKQKGHAGILTVLILPALWVLFSLGTDGARGLQDRARLDDALEAAALAVSAHNDDNIDDGSGSGSKVNQDIVKAYVDAYVTDKESITAVKIQKLDCQSIPDCVSGLKNGDSRFFQYHVSATTKHDSWFSSDKNFGNDFNVSSTGTSRKYQDHPVDVVFVSDFSGSMDNNWKGGKQKKYQDLRDVISAVTVELQKFNDIVQLDDNTISFVGFNNYARVSDHNCYLDQLDYKVEIKLDNGVPEPEVEVDFSKTVANVFKEKVNSNCRTTNIYKDAIFYDIEPTTDFTKFNSDVKTFRPDGYTASHQGIIRGAQLAMQGKNPRRLIIILSDGADKGNNKVANKGTLSHKSISEKLYDNHGLCNKIRNDLNAQKAENKDKDDVLSRIAVIGFDYDLNSNVGLKVCAGEDNVFKAENKSQILAKILELISEEIGHLK
ncbi:pilus assembly protein TadG-related protein [Vibrio pelagius]|uniref:pilus assembly protein TadG-related protein n=1 Tax=Vibrio pelagius TaxID=28169 RepID=UPI0035543FC6